MRNTIAIIYFILLAGVIIYSSNFVYEIIDKQNDIFRTFMFMGLILVYVCLLFIGLFIGVNKKK